MSTHPDPEQLSAYIDGELTGVERDGLEQHLTGCSDCSATVRALRATVADMRALPAPLPSEQESWALRAAITKARKGPATRYRRWATAAGSVAAVAIAVVAIATNVGNNKTATFGTGTEAAPLRRSINVSLITIDPADYNRTSALSLLGPRVVAGVAVPAPQTLPKAGSSPGTTSGTGGSTTTLAPSNQFQSDVGAQAATYATAIRQCETLVLPSSASNLTPLSYIVGTFENTPVFFLLYSVASGKETKQELYVVQRNDCYIRFFVPPR